MRPFLQPPKWQDSPAASCAEARAASRKEARIARMAWDLGRQNVEPLQAASESLLDCCKDPSGKSLSLFGGLVEISS